MPFPLTKLIAYKNYVEKYKSKHFKISTYYGHLNSEEYQKYISQIHLIKESKYFKKNSYKNELFLFLLAKIFSYKDKETKSVYLKS